ncbi:uncharacterized protein Z518_10719 [Rhinocladiella mackenziei CBS 650.93]|uniref:Amidohydrolase-related domain-containing protein n=1 Tax=Rhinocladiella mackenziei CBS 650.93 TaxID=1442369 RepID=A0A0D2FCF9_9EURO|nr:uncharacterized protein Z518_10719 [Rhinocladiella mackenziei CBS 650.93]KIW99791.1 hypothetical protein Z518_10719 [Rhinocladiella mackenziei CBS 650.93]
MATSTLPKNTGNNNEEFPIIDSHIHLYAATHIPSLNWTADLPSTHPLNRQYSTSDYLSATEAYSSALLGFVFLETDRKSGLHDDQWTDALNEVDFLVRVARGEPREGEGHAPEDKRLVLGIVPWAPLPNGKDGLARYILHVKQHAAEKWDLIKGFRYLVQDKPPGVMLRPEFIEGLRGLGKIKLSFDLGVDARSGGMGQLQEACEMMERLYSSTEEDKSQLTMVINHLCKPNLRLAAPEARGGHPDFTKWKECVYQMAGYKSTYMKLSGMFSELPERTADQPTEISALVEHTKPWVDVVFDAFGSERIMFGSDWPVCNVGGPGIAASWRYWHALVAAILDAQGLTAQEKAMVWSGTAVKAYGIKIT